MSANELNRTDVHFKRKNRHFRRFRFYDTIDLFFNKSLVENSVGGFDLDDIHT